MDVSTVTLLFGVAAIVGIVTLIWLAIMFVVSRLSEPVRFGFEGMRERFTPSAIVAAWIPALLAMIGSLYYSEIVHYQPCTLCWYQRIAMYPLVPILAIAAWKRDAGIWRYAVPVAAIGAAISIYHYQLERFPNQASPSCSVEAPCTVVWVWRFHYISIAMMALSAALLIIALLWAAGRGDHTPWRLEDAILPDPG